MHRFSNKCQAPVEAELLSIAPAIVLDRMILNEWVNKRNRKLKDTSSL